MKILVNGVHLYFDVKGAGLRAQGALEAMALLRRFIQASVPKRIASTA